MLWYIIGGFIGLVYFKQKYHLSFWSAVGRGILVAFGIYFGFIFAFGLLNFLMDPTGSLVSFAYPFIFAALAYGCFRLVHNLNQKSDSAVEKPVNSLYGNGNTDSKIERPVNSLYGGGYTDSKVEKAVTPLNNWGDNEPEDYSESSSEEILETRIAGVTFEDRQALLRKLKPGQHVLLEREPDNSYDSDAIKVILKDENHSLLGYIPGDLAATIAVSFDDAPNTRVVGTISSVYHLKNERSILGAMVKFSLPEPEINSQEEKNYLAAAAGLNIPLESLRYEDVEYFLAVKHFSYAAKEKDSSRVNDSDELLFRTQEEVDDFADSITDLYSDDEDDEEDEDYFLTDDEDDADDESDEEEDDDDEEDGDMPEDLGYWRL